MADWLKYPTSAPLDSHSSQYGVHQPNVTAITIGLIIKRCCKWHLDNTSNNDYYFFKCCITLRFFMMQVSVLNERNPATCLKTLLKYTILEIDNCST